MISGKINKGNNRNFISFLLVQIFVLVASTTGSSFAQSSRTDKNQLYFEILLTKGMLTTPEPVFIDAVAITSNRHAVISSSNQFYLIGWGGINLMGQTLSGMVKSFTVTPGDLIMIVRNNELCAFDSSGDLRKLYKLPSQEMGITSGKYVLYVYDRKKEGKKHSCYIIGEGGKYLKLFEVPFPITALEESNNAILFGTENGLFAYDMKEKSMKALISLPKDSRVNSITTDTSTGRIYFSDNHAVYALTDQGPIVITDVSGGIIKFFSDGLVIFNPEQSFLFRISNIEENIRNAKRIAKPPVVEIKTSKILNNESIIEMVKAGLSEDIIIGIINKSQVNFDTSIDAMIALSNSNVTSNIIKAMKSAMKKGK